MIDNAVFNGEPEKYSSIVRGRDRTNSSLRSLLGITQQAS